MGAPGDDQGARRRGRPGPRRGVRRGRGASSCTRDDLHEAAIHEVRRSKVRLEEYIRRRGKELTEVKRGRGGIRDVEFAVQLLQIVHGRRDERLREPEHARAPSRRSPTRATSRRRTPTPSPTPTGSCAGWSTGSRWCATSRPTTSRPTGTRARRSRGRSASPAPTRSRPSTTGPRSSSAGSTSACSTGRSSRRSPARSSPRPGHDREATEELLAGLGFAQPLARVRVPAAPRRVRPRGSARSSRTCSP